MGRASMTYQQVPSTDVRIGDKLSDGSIVYDIAESFGTPDALVIASAPNGASGAIIRTRTESVGGIR